MNQVYQSRTAASGRWFAVFLLFFLTAFSVQAQISGVVYRDFDLNGIRSDTLPIEVGVQGIRVRAFVDISRTPILTTTDADGKFSFSPTQTPAGAPVRIEFGQLSTGDFEGPFGAGSGTRVQFVTAGIATTAIQVGLNVPADFCQRENIKIATPCYVNGDGNKTTNEDGSPIDPDNQAATAATLVSFPYQATGITSATNFPLTYLATAGQTGATWGLAYQRSTKKLFSSATLKRHTSYGPLGPGGIYMTDINTNVTTSFLNVVDIGINVGANSHSGLPANKLLPSADPGPMQTVGKESFGGIDMSEDDRTLYFVNLNDRKIYGVFLDAPARTPTAADVKSWSIPDPGCANGDFRPWALKVYRGKIYVGVVCSAESSQKKEDLSATIYRFDPTQANPVFETVISFPLDFRRGPSDNTADCVQYDHWLPWTDKFPAPCGNGAGSFFVMHPQPLLVDMEFDQEGSLIIGFLDRFGSMSGDQNLDPQGNGAFQNANGSQQNFDGFAGGDLLRAFNNNGVFELEKNGKSGPYTGSGVGNNEGPVDANGQGGEFFGLDNWIFFGNVGHSEVANGALTLIPGYNEVLTSAFDPIAQEFKAGGLKSFHIKTGGNTRNFIVYRQLPGSFGKASGLGDSKALCDPAPIEIGNRIWFDDNRDGIQDAYEPGVDGIVLTLHDMDDNGKEVGTQTTRDGGQYYFNNTTVPTGVKFNRRYEVRMTIGQLPLLDITLGGTRPLSSFTAATGGGSAGGRLAAPRSANGRAAAATAVAERSYTISPLLQTDGNDDTDQRNSKATVDGTSAVISVTTGSFGQNNFTFDLSMFSCPILVPQKETVTICADAPLKDIVANGLHLAKTDQVRFVLFSSPQSGTAMYSGGTVLGTVSASAVSASAVSSTALSASAAITADPVVQAVLQNPAINTANNTSAPLKQYIYAIVFPTPDDVNCRQAAETEIIIVPALKAKATGGALTCAVTSVTLTGQALYGDDTPATSATFAWSGPGGFTSTQQNPVVTVVGNYTLTVGDGICPSSLSTAVAQVTSTTTTPTPILEATPGGVVETGTSVTLTMSGCNGGTVMYSAGPIVQIIDGTNVFSATCTNTFGCTATTTVSVTGVTRSIVVEGKSLCIKDTPYLSYSITAVNFTPQNGVAITLKKRVDGTIVETLTNQPLSGTLLYPGAAVDSQGNPTDWPGWRFENGEWIVENDGLRPSIVMSVSVNPSAETIIFYPDPTPACLVGPRHGLGDRVWKDLNGNGIQDQNEPGVPNISVELYEVTGGVRAGTPRSTTATDGAGFYLFSDLPFGTYQVRFVPGSIPASCSLTQPSAPGSITANDSNANPTTGFTGEIVLAETDAVRPNRSVDAGLVPLQGRVSVVSTAVCAAQPASLSATGCLGTLTWSDGTTGNPLVVSTTALSGINAPVSLTYTATCSITGAGGSTTTELGTITVYPTPVSASLTVDGTNPTCAGNVALTNGQLTVTGSSGTDLTQFGYRITTGSTFSGTPRSIPVSGQISSVLAVGTYLIEISNTLGCAAQYRVILSVDCQCPAVCLPIIITRIR